jgi:hypothetical protein
MKTKKRGKLSKKLSQKNAKNTKRGLPKFFDSPQNNLAKTLRTPAPPPQWEKSNKFVPLGKTKKIFFYTQIDFL